VGLRSAAKNDVAGRPRHGCRNDLGTYGSHYTRACSNHIGAVLSPRHTNGGRSRAQSTGHVPLRLTPCISWCYVNLRGSPAALSQLLRSGADAPPHTVHSLPKSVESNLE